ncbi:hypothetical protein [Aquimarina sp. 2201CG5-10]|uniref:hypothetical protein n=1 Tax=Aquimarina callyspongiae TaxID=3098150 RepID=UPI002AB580DA|nr:hypothetical protein [Aquimarina sp. 2201CG5-10]MDY8134842.1 hypothetical protein [Aquimarina sp. 2201CG5-10]
MKKPLSLVIFLITVCLHAQHNYDNQSTIYSLNGNVGITSTAPQSKLHLDALERKAFRIYREGRTDKYLSIWHGTAGAVIEPIKTNNATGILYLGGYDTPTNTFFARSGGSVAIGTTSVQSKLHLNALERKAFRVYREGRTDKYLSIWHGTAGAVIEPIRTNNSTGVLYLGGYDTPTNTFFARSGGTVGIGTTNTRGYKLAVNGKIRSQEIVVEASPWPDYVFKKEYELPTLTEVAKFIKEKGHLPNIPTEKEVSENGVHLGEINAKLLEKIEELTLYTIRQDQEIKELKEMVEKLHKKIN